MILTYRNFSVSTTVCIPVITAIDAWDSDRQTNKLTEEQFKAWVREASKVRQEYKTGDISGEQMLKHLLGNT